MIAVIATLRVREGKQQEFESAMKELQSQVQANESDCQLYQLTKKDDTTYKMLENYSDRAALDRHGKTEYFRAAGGKLAGCLAGAPDIEVLEVV